MNSHNLANIRLITMREFKARLTRRSLIIVTVIGLAMGLIAAFIPAATYFGTKVIQASLNGSTHTVVLNNAGDIAGQNTDEIIVYLQDYVNGYYSVYNLLPPVNDNPTLPPTIVNAEGFNNFSKADTTDENALVKEMKQGKFDAVLVLNRDSNGKVTVTYHSQIKSESISDNMLYYLRYALNNLSARESLMQQGISLDQQNESFSEFTVSNVDATPTPVPTISEDSSADVTSNSLTNYSHTTVSSVTTSLQSPTYGLAWILFFLIAYTTTSYGPIIAHGVVEEKSSRVMELMVNAATPTQLFLGKLAGVGLLALVQIGIPLSLLTIGIVAQAPLATWLIPESHLDTNWTALAAIAISLVYMPTAFVMFGSIYAAVAAPLSRADEVQRALMPATILVMPGAIFGYASLLFGKTIWIRIISFFPLISPNVMIGRIAYGNINWLDLLIGLLINLVTTFFIVKLSARIYRRVILYYGKRKSFWELL